MISLDNWANAPKEERQKALQDLINGTSTLDYIGLVRGAGNWGVYASMGPKYTCAIFGRDSIVVAEDLLDSHQKLAHDILLVLAKLQGVKTNPLSEEEPGKIHHEYRSSHMNGVAAHHHSVDILHNLQQIRGSDTADSMIYYGSFDATPLFVRALGKYVDKYGSEILSETYEGRDKSTHTMLDSARNAMSWLGQKIALSPNHLLEFKRTNPNGILNQVWKDSSTSFLFPDGSSPNYNKGIAAIELQGYAYDAFQYASKFAAESDQRSKGWLTIAGQIQKDTLDWFWMEDKKFFAEGLDYDQNGKYRKIDTLTSNGAVILDSGLLFDLPQEQKDKYIKYIGTLICGDQFLSPAGIRCRSLVHKDIPNFIDYHGSYTVWPKETYCIAKGFRKHGLHLVATEIENRLLNNIVSSGEFYEFFYVEPDNSIWYDRDTTIDHFRNNPNNINLSIPEPGQAWTISAVLGSLSNQSQYVKQKDISEVEQNILNIIAPTQAPVGI